MVITRDYIHTRFFHGVNRLIIDKQEQNLCFRVYDPERVVPPKYFLGYSIILVVISILFFRINLSHEWFDTSLYEWVLISIVLGLIQLFLFGSIYLEIHAKRIDELASFEDYCFRIDKRNNSNADSIQAIGVLIAKNKRSCRRLIKVASDMNNRIPPTTVRKYTKKWGYFEFVLVLALRHDGSYAFLIPPQAYRIFEIVGGSRFSELEDFLQLVFSHFPELLPSDDTYLSLFAFPSIANQNEQPT